MKRMVCGVADCGVRGLRSPGAGGGQKAGLATSNAYATLKGNLTQAGEMPEANYGSAGARPRPPHTLGGSATRPTISS
jgi:hypothetical protein